jgi:hypothetical protein
VPPNSIQCTRPYNDELATLENSRTRSAIIHRTIRCATRLSGEPVEQRLPARQWSPAAVNSACQKSEHRSQRTPDYPVQQDDKGSNSRPAPNPNGWPDVAHTPDSAPWLSGGAPDYPVRPSPAAFTNGYGSGWGL